MYRPIRVRKDGNRWRIRVNNSRTPAKGAIWVDTFQEVLDLLQIYVRKG